MFKILFASLTKYAVHKVYRWIHLYRIGSYGVEVLIKWLFRFSVHQIWGISFYSSRFFCYSIVWTPPLESFNFEFLFMVLIAAVLFFKIHHGECTYLQKFIALVISHSHTPCNKKRQTNSYSSIKNLIIENKTSRKKYRVSNKRIFFWY